MKHTVVAIRDIKADRFQAPATVQHRMQALRSFQSEANTQREGNVLQQYPEDFELWQIAFYDDETGKFEDAPELIARANDLVQR